MVVLVVVLIDELPDAPPVTMILNVYVYDRGVSLSSVNYTLIEYAPFKVVSFGEIVNVEEENLVNDEVDPRLLEIVHESPSVSLIDGSL